jgi:hypothetical protein
MQTSLACLAFGFASLALTAGCVPMRQTTEIALRDPRAAVARVPTTGGPRTFSANGEAGEEALPPSSPAYRGTMRLAASVSRGDSGELHLRCDGCDHDDGTTHGVDAGGHVVLPGGERPVWSADTLVFDVHAERRLPDVLAPSRGARDPVVTIQIATPRSNVLSVLAKETPPASGRRGATPQAVLAGLGIVGMLGGGLLLGLSQAPSQHDAAVGEEITGGVLFMGGVAMLIAGIAGSSPRTEVLYRAP